MADVFNSLAPQQGVLNQLYKTVVPTNARVLIDTMRGETAPLTENDFSQDELEALRQMYKTKNTRNDNWRQDIANKLSVSAEEYSKNPETDWVTREEGGKQSIVPVRLSYDDYVRRLKNQLDSFDKTKGKTSIAYNDYPDGMAAPTFDSWLSSAWKSYTDPAYRMKTILGQFNVFDTPEGRKAVDQYNFDASDYYRTFYKIDPATASMADILKRSSGPVDFLDMMMIKKFPRSARQVDINLDR
jgi:hypothetical protein